MSNFFHKPELALRRAHELQGIQQPDAALALLHDVLSSRRHKTWSPTYESIMMLYLNLCLASNKSQEAKDGLHQYRNLSQSQAPGSLEKIIRYLIAQAEANCKTAKAKADAGMTSNSSSKEEEQEVDDLDNSSTPQSILLSTMSTDPEKTQRDSALLLPSLKFLWETYRAVLDIFKSNSKLEHLYHSAALGALQFCRTYKRRTEFRRLCDMMRMHLGNLQRYGGVNAVPGEAADGSAKPNNKVRGWDGWSSDSIEMHLQTRFSQLETASCLRLYTEGFRTVEDIFNILQISHARRKVAGSAAPPPKAKLMAAYYEKLTTLFWVSENSLFHAFAWYKYYTLCKEYNRGMSAESRQMQASAVLLAALCIPSIQGSGAAGSGNATSSKAAISTTVEDDIAKEKMARMATLLGFHTRHPTREALLAEIRTKNVMEDVPEYLRELYTLLEEVNDPLIMVQKAKPLLEKLRQEVGATTTTNYEEDNEDVEDTSLGRYVAPLTSVLLLKLLSSLSAAYHTVSLDHIKKLTSGLGITFEQVEKAIVLSTQKKTLSVRIDHRAGCLRFGDAALESDAMRSQLTVLSKQLAAVCKIIRPSDEVHGMALRSTLYSEVRSSVEAEHAAILERKNTIEKRKEEVERVSQEKLRNEMQIKAAEEAIRKAEEEQRILREQKLREKEKLKKIQDEMEIMEKKKYLSAMGKNTEAMTDAELVKIDTEALAKEHADKANRKKEEAERKTREAAKKLDYKVRAIRIEELPVAKTKYVEKVKNDRARYEAEVVEKAKRARLKWEIDVKEKAKLDAHSVFKFMAEFEKMAMAGRKKEHESLCLEEDKRAELAAESDKLARARKRKTDEEKRVKEEEERRIAEEEAEKAEEERLKREEARRKKEAEEEERRAAEDARMQEERQRKERERQQSVHPPPPSKDLGSSTNNRYVPPSMRNRQQGSGGGGGGSYDRPGARDSYGGGRYEGPSGGGGGRRFGGAGDSRGGGPRDSGDSRGGPRDSGDSRGGPRDSGAYRRPGDRDSGDRGPPEPRNSRWG